MLEREAQIREDIKEREKRELREQFKKDYPGYPVPDDLKRDHKYSNRIKENIMPW